VSQRSVHMERDIWILLQSVSPKEAAIWIADKRDAIDDPGDPTADHRRFWTQRLHSSSSRRLVCLLQPGTG
jgi:hypothetical protein